MRLVALTDFEKAWLVIWFALAVYHLFGGPS
jgi:hypothetical protein